MVISGALGSKVGRAVICMGSYGAPISSLLVRSKRMRYRNAVASRYHPTTRRGVTLSMPLGTRLLSLFYG